MKVNPMEEANKFNNKLCIFFIPDANFNIY